MLMGMKCFGGDRVHVGCGRKVTHLAHEHRVAKAERCLSYTYSGFGVLFRPAADRGHVIATKCANAYTTLENRFTQQKH